MTTLALEFSTDRRSVAVLAGPAHGTGRVQAQTWTFTGRDTPACGMIERVLAETGLAPTAIDLVAVGLGPGSATGVRAAIAFAQGWQLARGAAVRGFSSLRVLAAQLHAAGRRGTVWLAVDAQRGDFHRAGYRLADDGVTELTPLHLARPEALREGRERGEPVFGPGLAAVIAGAEDAYPEAAHLALLAAQSGAASADEPLQPIHLRETQFVKAAAPRFPP